MLACSALLLVSCYAYLQPVQINYWCFVHYMFAAGCIDRTSEFDRFQHPPRMVWCQRMRVRGSNRCNFKVKIVLSWQDIELIHIRRNHAQAY